jgi:hypothetical protein
MMARSRYVESGPSVQEGIGSPRHGAQLLAARLARMSTLIILDLDLHKGVGDDGHDVAAAGAGGGRPRGALASALRGFDFLGQCPGCRLLLGAPSPHALAAAGVLPLHSFYARPFSAEAAADMLEAAACEASGTSEDGEAALSRQCAQLAQLTCGVPLVIRCLGAQLAAGAEVAALLSAVTEEREQHTKRNEAQWRREATALLQQPGRTLTATAAAAAAGDGDDGGGGMLTPRDVARRIVEGRVDTGPRGEEEVGQAAAAASGWALGLEGALCGGYCGLAGSFRGLDETVRQRCGELACFPPGVPVPLIMLERLWFEEHGMDAFDLEHLLCFLEKRGWVQLCRYSTAEEGGSAEPASKELFAVVLHSLVPHRKASVFAGTCCVLIDRDLQLL